MTKPVIVTRAGKGEALTWTEGDANFTNLQDATFTLVADTGGTSVVSDLNGSVTLVAGTNVTITGDNTAKTITINSTGGGGLTELADDLSPTLGGNLDVSTYSIISSSNGDITIDPNGTGEIILIGSTVVESNRISNGGSGPGAFLIQGTSQNIEFSAADQSIIFTGAASVVGSTSLLLSSNGVVVNSNSNNLTLQSNTVKMGNSNVNATVTTIGTSDLILNTNGGTNSGNITILDGANQNITLTPNGTGVVAVSSTLTAGRVVVQTNTYSSTSSISLQQAHTTADANNINFARSRGTNASPAAVQTNDELFELVALGHDGSNYVTALDITTTTIGTPSTGFVPSKTEFKVRTDASTVETVLELASDAGGNILVNGVASIDTAPLAIDGGQGVDINSDSGDIVLTPLGKTDISLLNYNEKIHSLGTTSGTVAPDVSNGNVQTITLNGNLTLNAFTNPVAGQSLTLIVDTNGTGRTLTSSMKFAGGEKTLSTTDTVDIISVFYDGTNYWASLAKDFK